jgi:hypothetical protein
MTTLAPVIRPINGNPERTPVNEDTNIPNIIAGKIAANIALPTPPDFLPPTSPAMSGPRSGSQNSKIEMKNIHRNPLIILPLLLIIPPMMLIKIQEHYYS